MAEVRQEDRALIKRIMLIMAGVRGGDGSLTPFYELGEEQMDRLYDEVAALLASRREGWVDVRERLPEETVPVLVAYTVPFRDGNLMPMGISAVYKARDGQVTWAKCLPVTHWQPLPPPPQKGASDE
jgi:hypothetical protein